MQYTPQCLNKWETVIIAETQDGSGVKICLEAYNHDSERPQYRVLRYGKDNENIVDYLTPHMGEAKRHFDYLVESEIMGYFGLEAL